MIIAMAMSYLRFFWYDLDIEMFTVADIKIQKNEA